MKQNQDLLREAQLERGAKVSAQIALTRNQFNLNQIWSEYSGQVNREFPEAVIPSCENLDSTADQLRKLCDLLLENIKQKSEAVELLAAGQPLSSFPEAKSLSDSFWRQYSWLEQAHWKIRLNLHLADMCQGDVPIGTLIEYRLSTDNLVWQLGQSYSYCVTSNLGSAEGGMAFINSMPNIQLYSIRALRNILDRVKASNPEVDTSKMNDMLQQFERRHKELEAEIEEARSRHDSFLSTSRP
jgi:hypothetical protein